MDHIALNAARLRLQSHVAHAGVETDKAQSLDVAAHKLP